MKKLLTLLTVGLSLSLGSAFAADAPAKSSQQNKMASCNKDAGDKKLKGDERKAFMKDCLSAKPAAAASAAVPAPAAAASGKKGSQQAKMKNCNKDAGDKKLKGDERKAFMKDCLSK
ncbi:MAG: PsiF family protein [Comamonadaceae bacterium]